MTKDKFMIWKLPFLPTDLNIILTLSVYQLAEILMVTVFRVAKCVMLEDFKVRYLKQSDTMKHCTY